MLLKYQLLNQYWLRAVCVFHSLAERGLRISDPAGTSPNVEIMTKDYLLGIFRICTKTNPYF